MKIKKNSAIFGAALLFCACAEEPQPPSVDQFVNDSVLLDATMVRCSANRSSTKYEPECVNAREAINRIAHAEETARRVELEAQSERKRRALRRTQEAAAAARLRAAEAKRQREEAAYLAQFESVPPSEQGGETPAMPAAGTAGAPTSENAGDGAQAPVTPSEPEVQPPSGSDLERIREELKRRQDGATQ